MSIIGFLAKQRHGKDTAADYLVNKYQYKKLSFAKPIKDACEKLFGFTKEQLYGNKKEVKDEFWGISPRTALRWLGTDIFREQIGKIIPHIKNNFWVTRTNQICINEFKNNPKAKLTVADVRFQNEVDAIHDMGGIVIKIYRPNMNDVSNHISEKEIDNIKNYDKLIVNDGTIEDLYKKIHSAISSNENII